MRSITRRIVAILVTLLLYTNSAAADRHVAANSLNSAYSDNQFLFTLDRTTGAVYYCVKYQSNLLPWISYSTIYIVNETQRSCVLRCSDSVTSIYVLNGVLYYVAHDSLSHRGRLIEFNLDTRSKRTLLPASYGVGRILGVVNEQLYVETDSHICVINTHTGSCGKITSKKYYVAEATYAGITFYFDGNWCYLPWEKEEPVVLFASDTPPVSHEHVIAIDENRYVRFDYIDSNVTLVCKTNETHYDEVYSISVDSNLVAVCTYDGVVRVYSIDDGIVLQDEFELGFPGQIYIHERKIVTLDIDGNLSIIEIALVQ